MSGSPGNIIPPWTDLQIPDADFDVGALYSALDEQRTRRGISWKAVAQEINRAGKRVETHPISPSTIIGLKTKRWGVEGDGVLQMLLWLDRSPESFVPGHPGAAHPDALLPRVTGQQIVRFDVPLIYSRLDALRTSRGLTWVEAAGEVGGGCNADQLKNMGQQQRTRFPQVMRLTRWLRCPAAALTRMSRF